jgi:DNA repair protein RadC
LIRAGQLVKIEVLDHLVMGKPDSNANVNGFLSLRALGYFSA